MIASCLLLRMLETDLGGTPLQGAGLPLTPYTSALLLVPIRSLRLILRRRTSMHTSQRQLQRLLRLSPGRASAPASRRPPRRPLRRARQTSSTFSSADDILRRTAPRSG